MRKITTLLVLILTFAIYTSNINVQLTAEENNYRTNWLELTPHDPIYITSDSGFEVFPGSGTAEDPYVIEGYNITTTSTDGICITDTTKYFIVRNCYVDAIDYGIEIRNVADGTATVINNTCSNTNYRGITLWGSSSSTVTNNTCNNNNNHGIYLLNSDSSTVINNTCSNNNEYGIDLFSSSYCVVIYNLLQENERYGVYLDSVSDNNLFHHNNFVNNNLGGSSQAIDNGRKNKWYDPETKEGNYWSDLGDKCTYKIDGKAHSKDLYPLNREQSCPNPITMIILSIILPLLVSIAILAFVVPKYAIPYTRKTIIPYLRSVKIFLKKNPRSSICFSILLILTIVSGIMLYLSIEGISCDGLICIFYMYGFFILTIVLASVSIVFLIVLIIIRLWKFRSSQNKVS